MAEQSLMQVRHYILHNFLFDDESLMVPNDASLLANGILDSTGILDLLLFLEETFNISIQDEEVLPENFDSVERMVAFVQSKRVPVATA